jgi:Cu/Ag efflux protein CusF
MLKRFMTIGFVVLLLGWGISAGELQAAGSSNSLNGTLYIVDVTGHSVTLKDANGTATILNVTRKTKMLRNNKKVNLAGLVLGDQVAALFDNSNNAKQLAATGPVVSTLQGGVGNVTSGTGVVQIANRRSTTNAQTNVQTRVVRNGKISSLKSLTLLDKITTHLAPAGSLIHSPTQISLGVDDAVDILADGPEESDISGTISAVDTGANTVTITPKDGSPDVTADTLIEVGGVPATINDLAVDMFIEAEYDPTTLNAFRIEAENPEEEAEAEGPITAIDTVAGTVTIDCYGTPVTVIVDASTQIKRNDAPATLTDLQVGDEASAEYNSVTMVAHEVETETPGTPD